MSLEQERSTRSECWESNDPTRTHPVADTPPCTLAGWQTPEIREDHAASSKAILHLRNTEVNFDRPSFRLACGVRCAVFGARESAISRRVGNADRVPAFRATARKTAPNGLIAFPPIPKLTISLVRWCFFRLEGQLMASFVYNLAILLSDRAMDRGILGRIFEF